MSTATLSNWHFRLVCFTCNVFATYLIIVFPTTDASNSFTPINCYDCASSPSSSSQPFNSVYTSNDVNDSANRNGQYVGSVMKAQLDDQVSLHGDNTYSTQYDPSSSTLLGISGGYSATNINSFPEIKSPVHEKYSSSKYHKSNDKEKLGFPTKFGGNSFGSGRGPFNGLGGRPFGGPSGGPFGGPGGGPFGGLGGPLGAPGGVFPGSGGFPTSQQFANIPGSAGFSGTNVPVNTLPGGQPSPFGNPAFGSPSNAPGNLAGSAFAGLPPNGGFPGATGNFPTGASGALGVHPGSPTFPGIPGNVPGFGVVPQTAGFSDGVSQGGVFRPQPGVVTAASGNVPAGVSGSPQGGNPNGIPQILGQQFIGDMENGVGEVVQPAQTELKPEVVQSVGGSSSDSTSSSDSFGQQQDDYASSGYFYGYPPSNYQQPLPDITEAPSPAPNPTAIIPINKPEGGPPVPVLPPPVYGYYYIGRKAWYVPLYFCVYFIIYVGCLILKDLYRHKAHYPEKLHEAVVENSRKNTETVQLLTDFIMTAFEKFNAS